MKNTDEPAQIYLKLDQRGLVSQSEIKELSNFMDPQNVTGVLFKDLHKQDAALPVDSPITSERFGGQQPKLKLRPKCDGHALHSIHADRMAAFLEAVTYLIIEKRGYSKETYPFICGNCHMVIGQQEQEKTPCQCCGQVAWENREK